LCLPAERPGNVIAFAFSEVPLRLSWRELRSTAEDLERRLDLPFGEFVVGLKRMNLHDAAGIQLDA
jgi:hypothetical protein